MSEKTQTNSITIAGAGFCDTTILANQIREIQRAWAQAGEPDNFPQTKIIVADPRANYGPGDPYEQKSPDNRALLNQAAYAMSPFPDEPDHFTNYLDNRFNYRSREDLENSFQQRPIYGEYLNSVFNEAVQIATAPNFPVDVELIPTAITDAFDLGDQTWQVSANARS